MAYSWLTYSRFVGSSVGRSVGRAALFEVSVWLTVSKHFRRFGINTASPAQQHSTIVLIRLTDFILHRQTLLIACLAAWLTGFVLTVLAPAH